MIADVGYIMKSTWHRNGCKPEAKTYKYLKERQLTGMPGPDITSFLVRQDMTFNNKDGDAVPLSATAI